VRDWLTARYRPNVAVANGVRSYRYGGSRV